MSSIGGAVLGLALPSHVVQTALGVVILGIVAIMASVKNSEFPHVPRQGRFSEALSLHGIFHDRAHARAVTWQANRTSLGLLLFTGIGVLAGLFGLGAGWANLPVLNLVMGVPLKVSAASCSLARIRRPAGAPERSRLLNPR